MSDPIDPDQLSTQPRSKLDEAAREPRARLSESAFEEILGAQSAPSFNGWQPPTPESLQASFGQYEIRGVIGRGGMGAVYLGWQKSLDRLVAIKILPPGLVGGEVDFGSRFKREAKAMARLKHPAIIPVHDAGETPDGLLYFIMDYVEGADLQKMIAERGRLPPDEALPIVARVLEALACAHAHGIIHRDIKPANIMIDHEGQVHVADFGLARSTAADGATLTVSSMAMGTPDFMAPESRLGMAQVDHRADLYAVGVMLYQMLTGKLPRGRFDAPSHVVPGLDKRLDRIVDRTLQADRDSRYSSAMELHSDLEPVLTRTLAKRVSAGRHPSPARKKAPLLGLAMALAFVTFGVWWFIHWKGTARNELTTGLVFTHPTTPAPAPALEPGAVRLWDAPEKITFGAARWEDGALRLDKGCPFFMERPSRDAILRARIKMNVDAEFPQLNLRRREISPGVSAYYRVIVLAREKAIRAEVVPQMDGKSEKRVELASWPLPRSYGPSEWGLVEFRIEGDRVTGRLDGQTLGSVQDSTLMQPGGASLYATKNGYFRDIVYVPLDNGGKGSPITPTAASEGAPLNGLGMDIVPAPTSCDPTGMNAVHFKHWALVTPARVVND